MNRQQTIDAITHLLRGFVGKSDRQNRGSRNIVRFNQMGNPMRNHACLAAARASQQ